MPVASWRLRPASVAISGSTAWVAAEVQSSTVSSRGQRADQVAAARETGGGALVVARRAPHLRGQLRLAGAPEAVLVLVVNGAAGLAQEAQQPLARLAGQGLELVAEHRRDAQRDRRLDLAEQSISGRYTHDTASHSHSSPNGQVPKPST